MIVSRARVSISLSSGFSFQAKALVDLRNPSAGVFQSRYRAASHFRAFMGIGPDFVGFACFNLVIERLLISGHAHNSLDTRPRCAHVSISLSSGFSFQADKTRVASPTPDVSISLSSGFSFQDDGVWTTLVQCLVSISLSSGFSFQAVRADDVSDSVVCVSISLSSGFSFQVHRKNPGSSLDTLRQFQSRYRAASHFRTGRLNESASAFAVSISLSSGFSFQEEYRWDWGWPAWPSFNLVIERLLISGRAPLIPIDPNLGFNLVIERLLISG